LPWFLEAASFSVVDPIGLIFWAFLGAVDVEGFWVAAGLDVDWAAAGFVEVDAAGFDVVDGFVVVWTFCWEFLGAGHVPGATKLEPYWAGPN